MGNKKKTKWRRVPSAELSHITVKSSSAVSATVKSFSNSCSSELTSSNEPRDDDDGAITTSTGQMGSADTGDVEGFYVNGLWIPVPELKKRAARVNNAAVVPHAVLRGVPYLLPYQSSFCPSTCPRFQTIHSPDVPLHPNYFIPTNNHYLYYFVKGQPSAAADFVTEDGTVRQRATEEYDASYQRAWNAQSFEYSDRAKFSVPGTEDMERTDCGARHNFYNCLSNDHQQQVDGCFESSGSPLPVYQYPGYAFGQPVYSVPLASLVPPTNLRVQCIPSEVIGRVRPKYARRRKAYAEYAVVPSRKNSQSQQLDNSNGAAVGKSVHDHSEQHHGNASAELLPAESEFSVPNSSVSTENSAVFLKENTNPPLEGKLPPYASQLANEILTVIHKDSKAIRQNVPTSDPSLHITANLSSPASEKSLRLDICREILLDIVNKVTDSSESSLVCWDSPGRPQPRPHPGSNPKSGITALGVNPKASGVNVDVNKAVQRGNVGKDTLGIEELKSSPFSETEVNCNSRAVQEGFFHKTMADNLLASSLPDKEMLTAIDLQNNEDEDVISDGNDVWRGKNKRPGNPPVTQQPSGTSFGRLLCEESNSEKKVNGEIPGNKKQTSGQMSSVSSLTRPQSSGENEANLANGRTSPRITEALVSEETRNKSLASSGSPENFKRESASYGLATEDSQTEGSPHAYQPPFMHHALSSDTLIRETELELSKLHHLTTSSTLQKNQSIYKLAYDENVTDQSENEDLDAAPQALGEDDHDCSETCRPLQNDTTHSEILVHEADSASDAGSEDVELLPHRYQSESVQNCNKHIYVNNLSLAVEMLRTREDLPYDDEFKRLVDDDKKAAQASRSAPACQQGHGVTVGSVNHAFVEDVSPSTETTSYMRRDDVPQVHASRNFSFSRTDDERIQPKECKMSVTDSGVQSGDSGDEVVEAKQVLYKPDGNANKHWQNDPSEGYRRFGNQTRHQFSVYTPRATIVNPCLCCIIM